MAWQEIKDFVDDGKPVDLWVADESFEGGGQRFPDMEYRAGTAGERNNWIGEMLDLSDCGYTPDDVTHFMRITPPIVV
jgi:hypothetical protein